MRECRANQVNGNAGRVVSYRQRSECGCQGVVMCEGLTMAAIAPMADPVFSPIDEACEVFSKSYQHIHTIM